MVALAHRRASTLGADEPGVEPAPRRTIATVTLLLRVSARYLDGTRPLPVIPLNDAYHVLEAPGRAETPEAPPFTGRHHRPQAMAMGHKLRAWVPPSGDGAQSAWYERTPGGSTDGPAGTHS